MYKWRTSSEYHQDKREQSELTQAVLQLILPVNIKEHGRSPSCYRFPSLPQTTLTVCVCVCVCVCVTQWVVLIVAAYACINLIWMTQWTERNGWLEEMGERTEIIPPGRV